MSSATGSAKQVANSRPVEIGARVGLACYGVTHLLIAWLALQLAFGGSDQGQTNQNGAFQELASNTGGRIFLWVIVVGFVAVGLWRLGEAIWGFTYESDDKERWKKRAKSGSKVVVYAALAFAAAKTAIGDGSSGGSGQQKATAGVLGWPGGQFIVGAVGLGVIIAGGVKIYAGWKKKFLEDMSLPSDANVRTAVERTGQAGFIAKGLSIALIGVLVVIAAIRFDPAQSSGLDVALRSLVQQPYGKWLLALVALGLAAYGVFCFFDGYYHKIGSDTAGGGSKSDSKTNGKSGGKTSSKSGRHRN